MLSDNRRYEVVGEASDGLEAVRAIKECRPDLVLLDLRLPKMDGLAVLRNLRKYLNATKILVLTMHEEEDYVLEAFKLGVSGYCLKDANKEELMMAVSNVLGGKLFVSPGITSKIMDVYLTGRRENAGNPLDNLSSREQEVLKLIGEGYRVKQIAGYLFISERTVEKHRYNIMKKLDLHKTSELVAFAIRNEMVTT